MPLEEENMAMEHSVIIFNSLFNLHAPNANIVLKFMRYERKPTEEKLLHSRLDMILRCMSKGKRCDHPNVPLPCLFHSFGTGSSA